MVVCSSLLPHMHLDLKPWANPLLKYHPSQLLLSSLPATAFIWDLGSVPKYSDSLLAVSLPLVSLFPTSCLCSYAEKQQRHQHSLFGVPGSCRVSSQFHMKGCLSSGLNFLAPSLSYLLFSCTICHMPLFPEKVVNLSVCFVFECTSLGGRHFSQPPHRLLWNLGL